MTEVKDKFGNVLFSYDEMTITLKEEIGKYKDLEGANLSGADLECTDLRGANLSGADLKSANLRGANLSGADLKSANLQSANLQSANLRGANLEGTDLKGVNFFNTNLYSANLKGANLKGANFFNTNLYGAENVPDLPMACPKKGAFTAWKKVRRKYLIKLVIPEDARRSSAISNKCRCDKAMVVDITDLETNENVSEVINNNYAKCVYTVGEMVYPDSFDDNRWHECSHGIHFFTEKQDAINYY